MGEWVLCSSVKKETPMTRSEESILQQCHQGLMQTTPLKSTTVSEFKKRLVIYVGAKCSTSCSQSRPHVNSCSFIGCAYLSSHTPPTAFIRPTTTSPPSTRHGTPCLRCGGSLWPLLMILMFYIITYTLQEIVKLKARSKRPVSLLHMQVRHMG